MTAHTIDVPLAARSYAAIVDGAAGTEARFAAAVAALAPSGVGLVTDENVARHHHQRYAAALESCGLRVHTTVVPAGEASKSLTRAEQIADGWSSRLDRHALVVALGGGVVGDLGGFVASIFLRGVGVVQAPTSLMAQVDSAIGGKTAVNLPAGKNLVGTFHQPQLVWADTSCLATLPERERISGLAEVVKHGAIADAALFVDLEKNADAVRAGEPAWLDRCVVDSMRIKAAIVAADERETKPGGRARLNFGHTIGHALEAASLDSTQALQHGEAVALGMVAAARIGARLSVGDADLEPRLIALLARLGLPHDPFPRLAKIGLARLTSLLSVDKKRADSHLQFVVVDRLGSSTTVPVALTALREILSGELTQ